MINMKKRFFFLILLFVPLLVKGETLVYNVCENGCEYDDINEVYDEILSLPRNVTHDITLNIKDGRSYLINKNSCITREINAKVKLMDNDYLLGDMNTNGKIDLKDIIILIKKYLGTEDSSNEDIVIGDINNNNKLDLKDIILLIKTYLGN